MTYDTHEEADVRGVMYDKVVKGIANATYKFKPIVNVDSTSAWTNYFYRGSNTVLTGQAGNAVKGIPRGADFPQASTSWELTSSVIQKYGMEDNITHEDLISNNIDVRDRTLMKIAEAIASQVDSDIWDGLTESRVPTNIQSFAIADTLSWSEASCAVIDDLLHAKQLIATANYPTDNLVCLVSPLDYRYMMRYLSDNGNQFPTIGSEVAGNGKRGTIAGIQIIESNNVTASYALVCVPKRCATWKELVPLSTTTKEDPYKSLTIRAVEYGVLQLTDPNACCLIKNTQKP